MAKIFVVSDTHFNHANILNFTNDAGEKVRPEFSTVEEMNEHMIEKWNSVISSADHVYHLGDVHFGKSQNEKSNRSILSRLHGKKRLVLGNHDDAKDPLLHEFFEKIMLWRMFKEYGVVLSHTPMRESVLGEARWDGKAVNIHGHIHRNPNPSPKHINVSVEMIGYTPQLITDILEKNNVRF